MRTQCAANSFSSTALQYSQSLIYLCVATHSLLVDLGIGFIELSVISTHPVTNLNDKKVISRDGDTGLLSRSSTQKPVHNFNNKEKFYAYS